LGAYCHASLLGSANKLDDCGNLAAHTAFLALKAGKTEHFVSDVT